MPQGTNFGRMYIIENNLNKGPPDRTPLDVQKWVNIVYIL